MLTKSEIRDHVDFHRLMMDDAQADIKEYVEEHGKELTHDLVTLLFTEGYHRGAMTACGRVQHEMYAATYKPSKHFVEAVTKGGSFLY